MPLDTPTPDAVARAVDQMQSCLYQAGEDWSQGATHCAWLAGVAQARWEDAVAVALWQSLAEGLALACIALAVLAWWLWWRGRWRVAR